MQSVPTKQVFNPQPEFILRVCTDTTNATTAGAERWEEALYGSAASYESMER